MRMMDRNKRRMWLSKQTVVEGSTNGRRNYEYGGVWTKPVAFWGNATPQTGDAAASPFGTQVSYDVSIVLDDNRLGIEEGDSVWIDNEPRMADDGQPTMDDAYEVRRVSHALSSWAFALKSRSGR